MELKGVPDFSTVTEYSPVVTVRIADLVFGDSPRLNGEEEEHVRLLAEADEDLPPILVHQKTMRVIDGMHRVKAARLKGRNRIEAQFYDGAESAAFLLAVERNISHGLPLSLADRKAAATRILASHPYWSDRAIAASTGLSGRTVRTIRRRSTSVSSQSNERMGQDGRLRPLNAVEGRLRAWEIMKARPTAALREVAASAGVSLGTVYDVRERMRRGDNPVPAKHRAAAGQLRVPPEPPVPARPAKTVHTRDSQTTLERLRKDPSLRLTESGRLMLRWLGSHVVDAKDWEFLLESTPAHCMKTVSELARRSADAWQQLARELEQREYTEQIAQ